MNCHVSSDHFHKLLTNQTQKALRENLLVGMILKNSTVFDFESYLRLRSPVTSEFPPPL